MDADREYLLYRGISAGLTRLPEPVVRHGGYMAGWLAWTWADRRKRTAIRNMARVRGESPEAPSRDTVRMARRMFAAYGRYWAEVLWLHPRRVGAVERYLLVEGIEHYRAALAAGKGVIVALPHVGNWEVAGRVAVPEGARLVAVAEKLPNPRLADWFVDVRKLMGIDVFLADGSPNLVADLERVLAANGAVALLSDRDVTRRGVEVEFFGETTRLPVGPVTLGIRTGAPVLPVASYFRRGRGHRIVICPPLDLTGDTAEGMSRLARALEGLITADPEQWHMVQPNWPSDRKR